ncbi:MAG: hypothetical protein KAJ59_05050 [Thermodesulfovibrionia bacterium]|nr:hypothetical protein [Thermodesulfovibrionia bacterium]
MRRVYFTIFLVSAGVLIFEISLTRLFSIYLSHHFAFMVVSIAMLGIGAAGTAISLYPRIKNVSNIPVYALFCGISIILGYVASNYISFDPVKLSWDRTQVFAIALYCLLFSIPFFFAGVLIATVFSEQSKKSERIYCSDLLGAGAGSLAVLGILNISGPEYAVLTASTACFCASLLTGTKKIRYLVSLCIALNVVFIIIHPAFLHVRLSPYKNLSLALKYPGASHLNTYYNSFSRIDTLQSPAVRFAPGLSLNYLKPLPEQIGIAIDGNDMNAVTYAQDKDALTFLEFLPSSLAYEIKGEKSTKMSTGSVLIIEPKGGMQVLTAHYYGFKHIHKVESNPLFVHVVRTELDEFSGTIYRDTTWTGFGRSWLRGLRQSHVSQFYDVIDLPMTGTSVSSVFGASEDYRFTVEAFKEYISGLKRDGFISISLYLIPPPRTEFRILATIVHVLKELGAQNPSQHIAALRSWDSVTIIMKKSPLDKEEIKHIKKFSGEKRFDLVHYPGIQKEETNIHIKMPSPVYFEAFKRILHPEKRGPFLKNYIFNISPVHDDNPFFNYYLKVENIKVIYDIMGRKWQYFIIEGYLIPLILVQVLVLSIVLMVLPLFVKKGLKTLKRGTAPYVKTEVVQSGQDRPVPRLSFKRTTVSKLPPVFMYFAMIGLGFMFVEISLIQKSILSLENPAYAVAAVLTSILISSGIGSLFSGRHTKRTIAYFLLVLGTLIVIYSLIFPVVSNIIAPHSAPIKISMVFIALIPLGFFMGMPFPTGMKVLGQINERLIPWAWAINGCFSVLAPVLTIMLAMTIGFKTVLWLGALSYVMAFFALRRLLKE